MPFFSVIHRHSLVLALITGSDAMDTARGRRDRLQRTPSENADNLSEAVISEVGSAMSTPPGVAHGRHHVVYQPRPVAYIEMRHCFVASLPQL